MIQNNNLQSHVCRVNPLQRRKKKGVPNGRRENTQTAPITNKIACSCSSELLKGNQSLTKFKRNISNNTF